MPKILKEQGDEKEAAISGKQEESGQTDARKSKGVKKGSGSKRGQIQKGVPKRGHQKGVKSLLDSYFFLLYK